jgi:hypothetical protein
MRDTPEGIIEELRFIAMTDAVGLEGIAKEDLAAWEAADYIERLSKALERIRGGEAEPAKIAREALDVGLWMGGE